MAVRQFVIFLFCFATLAAVALTMYTPDVSSEMLSCKNQILETIKQMTSTNCNFVYLFCSIHSSAPQRVEAQLSCGDKAAKAAADSAISKTFGGISCPAKTAWLVSLCAFKHAGKTALAKGKFLTDISLFIDDAVKPVDLGDFVKFILEKFEGVYESDECSKKGLLLGPRELQWDRNLEVSENSIQCVVKDKVHPVTLIIARKSIQKIILAYIEQSKTKAAAGSLFGAWDALCAKCKKQVFDSFGEATAVLLEAAADLVAPK